LGQRRNQRGEKKAALAAGTGKIKKEQSPLASEAAGDAEGGNEKKAPKKKGGGGNKRAQGRTVVDLLGHGEEGADRHKNAS